MLIQKKMPADDGFRMPAEYENHRGTVLIWPVRPGSWPYDGKDAQKVFAGIAHELSRFEEVWVLADAEHREQAERLLDSACYPIHVLTIPTDDSWARDVGPTCVVNAEGTVRGIDWRFNAWGGEYNGLYASWERDNAAARSICEALNIDCYDAQDFVLEGGSIHTDGEGTVVVTEECLLSPGRNPKLTRGKITERLKKMLNAEKVIWLPSGIYHDETDGHVDNIFAFTAPGEAVLAWTDDPEDPQYELSKRDLDVLEKETDAMGRRIRVHKLLIPKEPVRIGEEDLRGLQAEPGEDEREVGERLAASYVNFYVGNGCVLVPQFGDENDVSACELLKQLFPGREVIPVPARAIIVGGGNIHCITQQIPGTPRQGA